MSKRNKNSPYKIKKIPCIFYLYLHSKVFQEKRGQVINHSELISYLHHWRIPKKLRPLIIKELVLLKLLKQKRYIYELKKPQIYEENVNKYYDMLRVYDKGK